MPVKLGLELVSIIGSHGVNAEREPLDDVVEKEDRIGLGVLLIDLESTDPGCIVNGCVLKAADPVALLSVCRSRNLTSTWT